MTGSSSPTTRRRTLGTKLRRLREAAGLRIEDAAARLGWSTAKLSRLETGKNDAVKQDDIAKLQELYQVSDPEERQALFAIASEANQQAWWQDFDDVLTKWFKPYVDLETAASSIRTYEPSVVPGLLQTKDYALAIYRAAGWIPAEEITRQVQLRMARQRVLDNDTLAYAVVLDEAVLQRPVGGTDAMRDQLHHLQNAASRPNVTLQVLPSAMGARPGSSPSPFVLLGFPEETGNPDVVYLDHLTGSLYLDKPAAARRYALSFERLQSAALSPPDTAALITAMLTDSATNPPTPRR